MILKLYRGLTTFGGPVISAWLRHRLHKGKEDARRFRERHGYAGKARPEGHLVWFHAASLGESVSMLPVIERILAKYPDVSILVTTGTVSSAELMANRLPDRAIHQYVPVDRVAWVRRFMDHWQPDLALWTESEFWPNLISETARREIPLILLNGRMSEKSFYRWQRQPQFIQQLLGCFDLCLGQTGDDTRRLQKLGARNIHYRGNLKFVAPPLPVETTKLLSMQDKIGTRPRWMAAQTHQGEEHLAGGVHLSLKEKHHGLLTIIAPRHPERTAAILTNLRHLGLQAVLTSGHEKITDQTDILLVDGFGELGLFYRLSKIVFIGKSLLAQGGQNPLEPARLGNAILFGPNMSNFSDISEKMVAAKAAEIVDDEASLRHAIDLRLGDVNLVQREAELALNFSDSAAGILDSIMGDLEPFLFLRKQANAGT